MSITLLCYYLYIVKASVILLTCDSRHDSGLNEKFIMTYHRIKMYRHLKLELEEILEEM